MSGPVRFIPVPEMRKVLGALFIASGAVHAAIMSWAVLVALRAVLWRPEGMSWADLCFMHFTGTVTLAIFAVIKKKREGEINMFQAGIDFLVGLAVFEALFRLVVHALARRWAGGAASWIALAPGLFYVYYGITLARGRQIWSRLNI